MSSNLTLKNQFDLMRSRLSYLSNQNTCTGTANRTPSAYDLNHPKPVPANNVCNNNYQSHVLEEAMNLKNKSKQYENQAKELLRRAEVAQAQMAINEHANMMRAIASARLLEAEANNCNIMSSLEDILKHPTKMNGNSDDSDEDCTDAFGGNNADNDCYLNKLNCEFENLTVNNKCNKTEANNHNNCTDEDDSDSCSVNMRRVRRHRKC